MAFFNSSTTPAVAEKDIEMSEPPTDSIASLAWSPQADFLAVGSWDNSVRIYEVGANGQSQGKAMYEHQGPALTVCWNKARSLLTRLLLSGLTILQEGNKVFSGGADNAGRMFDLSTGQAAQVAQHDAPIKVLKWVDSPQAGILASASWDKTIKYWDLRTPAPVATVQLPERCYTMDIQYPLMCVGTAERHIQIFNLNSPTTVYKSMLSPLKWQTRVISCFTASPANQGFAVGSVEGRVAIQYVEEKDSRQDLEKRTTNAHSIRSSNFSFKCHRRDSTPNTKDGSLVYAINDISFHPVHGTFSTAGSDGGIHLWDKDARNRLKTFETAPGPVSATAFNRNGSIFAYSISYDWSKGHAGMTPGHVNRLMLHACKDDEVKKRPRK
ncbi:Poly + rna export protein [Mycena indigotica]|uniref:Poly + rna export protein n=1 Tax=Mycena indigotica TaxID=2126181 RepID=A0A8H6T8I5_9AGAR|nr:Poly + rna export protein [Mycena indigotica]KAF7312176.1 Poly + rna export protein [Mycena indigotica]